MEKQTLLKWIGQVLSPVDSRIWTYDTWSRRATYHDDVSGTTGNTKTLLGALVTLSAFIFLAVL